MRLLQFFQNIRRRFLAYVLKYKKEDPRDNRRFVIQNLILLAIGIFFIFVFNFAIIIGTDTKFGVKLSEQAKQVYQTTVKTQGKRGTIYDRNGKVIAEDAKTYSVYAILSKDYVSATQEPLYIQSSQFDTVANLFKQYLDMDVSYTKGQLATTDVYQVSFGTQGTNLSISTRNELEKALEKEGIKGIAFEESSSRLYPNGAFASHFIGVTQSVENEDGSSGMVGQSGLELALNDILTGTTGKRTYEKDRRGITKLGTGQVIQAATDGQDVYTTLDVTLQTYLETQMNTFQEKAQGVNASATIVNAKTGEILATTQRPTFNPDTREGMSEEDGFDWLSQLYQSQYEPGSTIKVMTLAAAIDSDNFNPNEYYTNNTLNLYDTLINDWTVNDGRAAETLTFAQGFSLSSNVGMTLLEQRMGDELWQNYLDRFRFGYPTRFGQVQESSGFLSDNAVNIAMSSFGQGISVTQTQMLRAFTGISNDGVMLEPQFISKLVDSSNNTVRLSDKEVVGNPVSADAASNTRDYMVAVGTDPRYGTLVTVDGESIIQVANESVAVKSGTAQIAAPDGLGYLTGERDYIYSVVAMVPADNPSFLMYVAIQQPKEWSGMFWQDVVNPVLEEAVLLEESLTAPAVSEDGQKETAYKMPKLLGEDPGTSAEILRRNLVHPIILGNGNEIVKTSVVEGKNVAANQQVLFLTSDFTTLPDMYGWTKESVQQFAEWTNTKISFKGSGTVTNQSVKSGTSLEEAQSITITLGE